MSLGYVPSEISNVMKFPASLARLWHLRPYYGSIVHNVRGIYAYYLGWYDGNPAHLDELPPRETARKMMQYMGGVDTVVSKATTDFEKGEYRWVASILDQVLWAESDHAGARELAAATHAQLGFASENPTWRNAYLGAAQDLRHGLPRATKNARALKDVLKDMPVHDLLNGLSVRLDSSKSEGHFKINWKLCDQSHGCCHTELTNSVLINRLGLDDNADANVVLDRASLNAVALGEFEDIAALSKVGAKVDGDTNVVTKLFSMLDKNPQWFPIATHCLKKGEPRCPCHNGKF